MAIVTVVDVVDLGDPVLGIPKVSRRFQFEDREEAWKVYRSAKASGFEATAEKVRTKAD